MARREADKRQGSSPREQQQLCLRILAWLVSQAERSARDRQVVKVDGLRSELLKRFPAVTSQQLRAAVRSEVGPPALFERRFLYFEPFDKGGWFLPVASLKLDLSGEAPELRVKLFLIDNTDKKNRGYRYETPEGPDSIHNFYHVQPIRSFDKGGEVEDEEQMNTSQPSIPLDADSPVALLLAVVVSCYGTSTVRAMLSSQELHRIRDYVKNLHWPKHALAGAS